MIENVNMNGENKDIKGIAFAVVGILTIIVAIAGATFAYFQTTVANNNVIKGNSAYSSSALTLSVTEIGSVSTSKKLVPQLDAYVKNAANSTNKCIDANSNGVCQHYKITVKNNYNAKLYLDGTFALTAASMTNLKWLVCSGEWNCTSTAYKAKTTTALTVREEFTAGQTKDYYVVLWISETGSAQTDSGSITGTVTFNGYNTTSTSSGQFVAGVSSSIRS